MVPGTTEVAAEICLSLSATKGIELFGAGTDRAKGVALAYKEFAYLPTMDSITWRADLEGIVEKFGIDYIFLAHDEWVFQLSDLKDLAGAKIIGSPKETLEVCRFKSKTYSHLSGLAQVLEPYKKPEDVDSFPVFVKPDKGQGSIGAQKVFNSNALEQYIGQSGKFLDAWIVMPYIDGPEFTIDCFSDLNGQLIYANPRLREDYASGIARSTKFVHEPELMELANYINKYLKFEGPWFFQAKQDTVTKKFFLLEVACRISGASGINRTIDINLPELALYQAMGHAISIETSNIRVEAQKILGNTYITDSKFDQIFIDFDDTLILNGKLNADAMKFLIDRSNEGSKLNLLTRHENNINSSLVSFRLLGFFEKIFHLQKNEPKSSVIFGESPLFIDDSFAERSEVRRNSVATCIGPASLIAKWIFAENLTKIR